MVTKKLTPDLLDLMEHEKVIEHGLQTFIDVGWALLQIRDGRKYRAAGYATFERYVAERWSMSKRHANRLVEAAKVVDELGPVGPKSAPTHESQVRPLSKLPSPQAKREAWAEAVEEAGGDQPTAEQVERAVTRRRPPDKDHPAPFSDPILDQVAAHLHEVDHAGALDGSPSSGRNACADQGGDHQPRRRQIRDGHVSIDGILRRAAGESGDVEADLWVRAGRGRGCGMPRPSAGPRCRKRHVIRHDPDHPGEGWLRRRSR